MKNENSETDRASVLSKFQYTEIIKINHESRTQECRTNRKDILKLTTACSLEPAMQEHGQQMAAGFKLVSVPFPLCLHRASSDTAKETVEESFSINQPQQKVSST